MNRFSCIIYFSFFSMFSHLCSFFHFQGKSIRNIQIEKCLQIVCNIFFGMEVYYEKFVYNGKKIRNNFSLHDERIFKFCFFCEHHIVMVLWPHFYGWNNLKTHNFERKLKFTDVLLRF